MGQPYRQGEQCFMPLRATTMDENARDVGYADGRRLGLEEIEVSW
jgi:hypothetical protein